MMSSEQHTKIGKIKDAHGIKGDIYVYVFSGDLSWLNKITELTLNKKNTSHTFKIISAKPHKEGFICKLDSFIDRNKAEDFIGSEVFVDAKIFVSSDGESLYLNEILSFEVIDQVEGSVGFVKHFSSNGVQDLLLVQKENKNEIFEIPFIKEFVVKIDYTEKKIHTNLPEGLLRINDPEYQPE